MADKQDRLREASAAETELQELFHQRLDSLPALAGSNTTRWTELVSCQPVIPHSVLEQVAGSESGWWQCGVRAGGHLCHGQCPGQHVNTVTAAPGCGCLSESPVADHDMLACPAEALMHRCSFSRHRSALKH